MRDASATSPNGGRPTSAARAKPMRITAPHASELKDCLAWCSLHYQLPQGAAEQRNQKVDGPVLTGPRGQEVPVVDPGVIQKNGCAQR